MLFLRVSDWATSHKRQKMCAFMHQDAFVKQEIIWFSELNSSHKKKKIKKMASFPANVNENRCTENFSPSTVQPLNRVINTN